MTVFRRSALYSGFFYSGFCTPVIAALSPWLAQRDHLSNAQVGLYFAIQFFSSFLSSAIATRRPVWSLRIGFFAFGSGVLLLTATTHAISLGGAAMIGLGIGFVNTASNTVRAYSEDAAAGLLSLNFVWSLGTVASACVFRNAGVIHGHALPIIAFIALLHAAWWLRQKPFAATERKSNVSDVRLELLFALALFCYVGAENAIAMWTKLLISRQVEGPLPGIALTAFVVTMLLGRLASPFLMKKLGLSARALFLASIAGGATCILLVPIAHLATVQATLIAIAGWMIAPLFPLIVYEFTRKLAPERVWAFCICGLGASFLPYAMGLLSMRVGLAWSFTVPAAALLLVMAAVRSASAIEQFLNFPAPAEQTPASSA
jgi:fucose permease